MAPSSKSPDPGLVLSGGVIAEPPPPPPSARPPSKSARSGPPSTTKSGNHTPPHVLMEFKQRILIALGKLADRDTQQIAVEELDKLMESVVPDSISVFLSCLYDSDMQQKSVVKKECVRIFGALASQHADLLVPHLPKIIASIMRRLRDPDSSVRDACVDAISALSARMLSPSSTSSSVGAQEKENGGQATSSVTLVTFTKPLFDALSEQNKSVQTGAALCLGRVIENAKPPPVAAMARLCPRICKFMSNPNFLARPALLAVVGSLSQVGALGQQQLVLLMPCVHEALESSDWATRKAAAETLMRVASNLGSTLLSFKSATIQVLESCRFDKVKPVRDSVHDATQLWKSLPGTEVDSPDSGKKSASTEVKIGVQKLDLSSPSLASKQTSPVSAEGLVKTCKSSPNRLEKSVERPVEAVKRKTAALVDKKINPEFFQKLAARDSDDWQIEVVVPRNCPQISNGADVDAKRGINNVEETLDEIIMKEERPSEGVKGFIQDTFTSEPGTRTIQPTSVQNRNVECDKEWETEGHASNVNGTASFEASVFLEERICQLEQQQASLLQMFQDFAASSQENMFILQSRIRDLENMMEDVAADLHSGGKRLNPGLMRQNYGLKPLNRYISGGEYLGSSYAKSVTGVRPFRDRTSENVNKSIRHAMYRSSEPHLGDWDDEFAFRGFRGELAGAYALDASVRHNNSRGPTDVPRSDKEDLGADQIGLRRVWDRVPGAVRLGEGPSARSVWQASKDEATLAAIRVAGEDAEPSDVESLSSAASRACAPEMVSESLPQRSNGRDGKVYWSLWGSAMESVHAGDMESAYAEILSAEDENMLMRLMRRTGPVLDQLTVATTAELLNVVGQLLQQQQSHFELCIAWIQQVADMVVNGAAECFDLSLDSKKGILMALQESASMGLPDGWVGNTIDELLHQLSTAWSIESEN